ncbi:MAG: Helicase associated domain protein [Magnetococcales bacterium]|nr:Helicase associated domain protein [Magnetococcales bacterium]
MFVSRREKISVLDEELFHHLSSFTELEARIFGLNDPARQKKIFNLFVEGFLAFRSFPRTVEILPAHRLHEHHHQRMSLPRDLPEADGFLFLAESGCHPYHVLLHDPALPVTEKTWEPFLRLMEHSHYPLLFTNIRRLPRHWLQRDGFQHVTGSQLDGLSMSWFSLFLRWSQGHSVLGRPTSASEVIHEMLHRVRALSHGSATLVLPDGPEQDELIFHLAASPGQKRLTLIVTPGMGRITDLLRSWHRLTPPVPVSSLWVASGKEWDKNENMLPGEMDFPRVHDVAAIRRFLTNRDGHPRILWATYAAIPVLKQAQLGLPPIELTLLPDSQVLVQQARIYDQPLTRDLPASRQRLYLTSLPQRTTSLRKDRHERPAVVHAMDDGERFGPKVVLATRSQCQSRSASRQWTLMLIPVLQETHHHPETLLVDILSRCLKKNSAVGHVHITPEWPVPQGLSLGERGEWRVVTAEAEWDALTWNDEMRNHARQGGIILRCKTIPSHVRQLATCDLTLLSDHPEGIDTGTLPERLNAVMRPHPGATLGIVALPMIADLELETTAPPTRPDLTRLWVVVQTLRDMDPDFDRLLDQIRWHRGREGYWNLEPLQPWLGFVDDSLLDVSRQQKLLQWLLIHLTSPWQQYLGELARFHERVGHSDVPSDFVENPPLATWVEAQRKAYVRGWLTEEQISRLNQLGFDWDPKKSAWENMAATLNDFYSRHRHCNVPQPYPEDEALSQWVVRQRRDRQQGRMESWQVERLEAMQFIWDLEAWEWERCFARLMRWQSVHHHAWITDPFLEDPELGAWAARQRQLAQKQRLDEGRRQRLDGLGFVWDLEAAEWQRRFEQLLQFRRLYGHAQVEAEDRRHPELSSWCRHQRDLRQRNLLQEDRQQSLDGVGFVWNLEEAHWLEKFNKIKEIKLTLHRFPSLATDPDHADCVAWIEEQRQWRTKNRLHPARANRLNALGFIWSAKQEQWEGLFRRFLIFQRCHRHGLVPEPYPQDPELSGWVADQRRDWRRGSMDQERRARLEMAGFVFDPQAFQWQGMLATFARYQRHHGDDDPQAVHPSLAPLKDWIASQRRMRASGRLDENQMIQLTQLGFIWDPEAKFENDMIRALRQFMEQHGHCNIPPDYTRPAALSSWVRKLRTRKVTGGLSAELTAVLERMGFIWDAREAEWQEMIQAVETFTRERRHCIIPENHPENPRLPQWVKNIRKLHKTDALPAEKRDRLEQLGFVWDSKAVFWEEMFVALTGYHDRYGHSLVAENDSQHAQLAWWVAAQRKARQGGQLSEKQIERLDRLHFVWDTHTAQWLEMYRELFFFHQRHGHCLVKNDSPHHARLGDWCSIQRKAWAMGNLSEEKQARLDALGFIWDPKEVVVEEMFQNLERYRERFGHCNVPVQWPDNPPLGLWVEYQRQSQKKGHLDPGRKARLESMGFDWEDHHHG